MEYPRDYTQTRADPLKLKSLKNSAQCTVLRIPGLHRTTVMASARGLTVHYTSCCEPYLLRRRGDGLRWRVPVAPRYPSSSDDDSHPGVAIEFAPPPVDVEPDDAADVSNSDSDESIADEPEADDELPVRRSTRSTAGHHSNRYRLPMSVLRR